MKLKTLTLISGGVLLFWGALGAAIEPQDFVFDDESCATQIKSYPIDLESMTRATLQPYVRKTLRPVVFYSYGKESGLSPQEFFRQVTGWHFDTIVQTSMLGNGIYSDSDPFATIDYSSEAAPRVLRIGVPAGIGYLDERTHFRAIPLRSENEARSFLCQLRGQCDSYDCKYNFDSYYEEQRGNAWPSYDPRLFLYAHESQQLLKGVYQELGIRFIAGSYGDYDFSECRIDPKQPVASEAMFMDPDLGPLLELDFLTPHPSGVLTDTQRARYAELLGYFDSFNFDLDQHDTQFDPNFGGLRYSEESLELFEFWYSGLLQVVHPLPPDLDVMTYQSARSAILHATRYERLTSRLFGCSTDERYRRETFPEE